MRKSAALILTLLLSFALNLWLTGCSGGGGGGDSTDASSTLSQGWVDDNSDGVYDAYQSQELWDTLNARTSAGNGRGWGGAGNTAPGWVDADGDGVCDYATDPNLWANNHSAEWIDENGDGVCDNYPDRPQDGSGSGWGNGWR